MESMINFHLAILVAAVYLRHALHQRRSERTGPGVPAQPGQLVAPQCSGGAIFLDAVIRLD